ncbi:hypothetical protein [Streptomyces sp. NPDC051310]|uniref:hypothetical protein n=1 Tax=Streptomyces sp. NPDC051310 TaxID=3365649 RepID=UPI00378DF569
MALVNMRVPTPTFSTDNDQDTAASRLLAIASRIVVDIASDIGHDTEDEWGSLWDLIVPVCLCGLKAIPACRWCGQAVQHPCPKHDPGAQTHSCRTAA